MTQPFCFWILSWVNTTIHMSTQRFVGSYFRQLKASRSSNAHQWWINRTHPGIRTEVSWGEGEAGGGGARSLCSEGRLPYVLIVVSVTWFWTLQMLTELYSQNSISFVVYSILVLDHFLLLWTNTKEKVVYKREVQVYVVYGSKGWEEQSWRDASDEVLLGDVEGDRGLSTVRGTRWVTQPVGFVTSPLLRQSFPY